MEKAGRNDKMNAVINKPSWLIQRIPAGRNFPFVNGVVSKLGLNTVCLSASCPNMGECFGMGTATFLILGSVCTRRCRFCAVPKGSPAPPDLEEPGKLAKAVKDLNLKHVVITSVTRDDMIDGGAAQFAGCIKAIRCCRPGTTIEVLIPDFAGNGEALDIVLNERPDILNHNVETISRLYKGVRPGADYNRSLSVLKQAALKSVTKTGLMLGLGETREEVLLLLKDVRSAGVSALTIGQYLQPSAEHLPVSEYIHPNTFEIYAQIAKSMGFIHVISGPLVRSSYHAADIFGR